MQEQHSGAKTTTVVTRPEIEELRPNGSVLFSDGEVLDNVDHIILCVTTCLVAPLASFSLSLSLSHSLSLTHTHALSLTHTLSVPLSLSLCHFFSRTLDIC